VERNDRRRDRMGFRTAYGMALVLTTSAGCHPRPQITPLPALPLTAAVAVVNDNAARIGGALRAIGPVDGVARLENGRRVAFTLDGTLFFLAPRFVRFDLKRFGDRKLLIGSNATHFWYLDAENEVRYCGRHDDTEPSPEQAIPIPPEQLVDALGISPIPTSADAGEARLVQRVEDEYQQVLWISDREGRSTLHKEYWLDRRAPRLVRRVVFRDEHGVVQMESRLEDYKPLSPHGPLLPHEMTAHWPATESQLRFRVSRWTLHTDIGPDGVQFAPPSDCGTD